MKYFSHALLSLSLVAASSAQAYNFLPRINFRDAMQSAVSVSANPMARSFGLGAVAALSARSAYGYGKETISSYKKLPNTVLRSKVAGLVSIKGDANEDGTITRYRNFRNAFVKTATCATIAAASVFYMHKKLQNA